MTDEQITRYIAEKVMGWREHPDDPGFWIDPVPGGFRSYFSPLTDDNDCMMAWDKFAETFDDCAILHGCGVGGLWLVTHDDTMKGEGVLRKNRRRAICECMCKAVQEGSAE